MSWCFVMNQKEYIIQESCKKKCVNHEGKYFKCDKIN
jgi:hypothetical protein